MVPYVTYIFTLYNNIDEIQINEQYNKFIDDNRFTIYFMLTVSI